MQSPTGRRITDHLDPKYNGGDSAVGSIAELHKYRVRDDHVSAAGAVVALLWTHPVSCGCATASRSQDGQLRVDSQG